MLILDQRDVTRFLPMSECIAVVDDALRTMASGGALLPLRTVVPLPQAPNAFAMMPAYLDGPAVFGGKVVSVYPGNRGTTRDSHQGIVILFDAATGDIAALVDGTAITAIRTAAASAVATRALSRPDSASLAILGAGVQARMHVEAIALVRPITEVRIWSRTFANAQSLAAAITADLGIPTRAIAAAAETVRGADVVCTATAARSPILEGAWLSEGMHVNAVGASTRDARELDTDAVARARLYADRRESALNEAGDILIPIGEGAFGADHLVGEIGEVLLGRVAGRGSAREITLFKSLGLAIEDLAAARHAVVKATAAGAGLRVELGGRPHAGT